MKNYKSKCWNFWCTDKFEKGRDFKIIEYGINICNIYDTQIVAIWKFSKISNFLGQSFHLSAHLNRPLYFLFKVAELQILNQNQNLVLKNIHLTPNLWKMKSYSKNAQNMTLQLVIK